MSDSDDNFLGLPPELSDPAVARYAVLPVPYEGTVSYKTGTAAAPMAIIEASQQVEWFDEELLAEYVDAGVATYPVVQPAPGPEDQMSRIGEAAGPIVKRGKFLLTIGGEHGIAAPLMAAVAEQHGDISVLQLDAHADLRDTYQGSRYSHACVMRRILEVTDRICQIGIRSFSRGEYESCPRQAAGFITPAVIAREDDWIDRALDMLGENVYVTVDADAFDPTIAPGVGTPEPGGLSWGQALALLRRVCRERNVLAADICEVRPLGANHVTEFLAARLAYKIIAYTQAG